MLLCLLFVTVLPSSAIHSFIQSDGAVYYFHWSNNRNNKNGYYHFLRFIFFLLSVALLLQQFQFARNNANEKKRNIHTYMHKVTKICIKMKQYLQLCAERVVVAAVVVIIIGADLENIVHKPAVVVAVIVVVSFFFVYK